MKLRPHIWKETRESLIYLWIGLFVFLVLPAIGALQAVLAHANRVELLTSPWVVSCGGVLAVFVAVGSTCRDLVPRLMDFWQSRPVSPWVWMAVKYVVGLMIVELACIVPVAVERLVTRDADSWPALVYLPFLWFAIYSVAFLIGCLVRRTAQAAMISLVVMVLLWVLPTMLLWLRPFNITRVMRVDQMRAEDVRFMFSMCGLALVAAIAALLVAQFNLQVRANRRLMLGTLAGAGLLVLTSLGFKFGTNMPVLQTVELEPMEYVQSVHVGSDNVGLLATHRLTTVTDGRTDTQFVRKITLSDAGILIGPPVASYEEWWVPPQWQLEHNAYLAAADATHCYYIGTADYVSPEPDEVDQNLFISQNDGQAARKLLTIWKQPTKSARTWLMRYQQTLLAISRSQFIAYDVSNPNEPREISRGDHRYIDNNWIPHNDEALSTIFLPELPGVPGRERLDFLLSTERNRVASEGDLAVATSRDGFVAYRLQDLNDKTATFVRTAQHRPTAIENVFGTGYDWDFRLKNGLLYTSSSRGRYDSPINPSCTVYDAEHDLKQVGHFAAAGAGEIYPLADGRSIVAGRKVYLVGAVKR